MKFQTADLTARVEQLIATRTAEADKANADANAEIDKTRVDHLSRTNQAWLDFAKTITARARKNQPVRYADTPEALRDRWREGLRWYAEPQQTAKTPNVAGLQNLLTVLKATTDDFVTTTGLRELGFRDLDRLFGGR